MKKTMSIMALGLLALPGQGWAADNGIVKKQIEELIDHNRMLQERVLNLENRVGPQPHEHPKGLAKQPSVLAVDTITQRLSQVERLLEDEIKTPPPEQAGKTVMNGLGEYVELSGLVEVEAGRTESYDHSKTSDLSLATVELGMDVHLTDWSHAHMVLLYEEGEEDEHLKVDEGTITLGNGEKLPVWVTVGKKYLPFGSYLTSMVSDPLTLEIGEIGDTIAQLGFQAAGLYGSAYIFNGEINERGAEDKIDSYGANLGFAQKIGGLSYDMGMDWLNNIADTDGMGDYLTGVVMVDEIAEYVPGFAGHILMAYGPLNFFAEYVGALESFDPLEMSFKGHSARPEAWGAEVGYNMEIVGRETLFCLGYQGTAEALALELPQSRYLLSARLTFLAKSSIALEYSHDDDYGSNSGNTVTMQLAVEF